MFEFFSEHHLAFRTFMLSSGWSILVISSVILAYKAIGLHKKIKHVIFGKLVIPTLIGWLVTMYSLGIVTTFYVFDDPKKGMLVAFPIFIIWAISIAIVFIITSKWGSKGIRQAVNIVSLNNKLEKANMQLQQLDEMKSEFINIAAHQLRTPLSEIKWSYDFIINDKGSFITPEQKDILIKGQNANEKIIKIVNNLLEVEKTKEGKWGYTFKIGFIEKIANNVISNFSSIAENKKITVKFSKKGNKLPEILIDSMKIGVVFSILIENAINYTSENGKVEVIVQEKGDDIKISIKDNGIGIPKDQYEKVFSKFFRSNNAIRVQTDGTGLGLHIAKNIIDAHGGKIWFESEEMKGTTFYFTLPTKKVTK